MDIKRKIYIAAFTLLGLMIGFLLHALIEVFYIRLLVKDFVTYSFGLTWTELIQFHYLISLVLLLVCGLWGWTAGRFWWKQIYVLKKYNGRRMLGLWRW